MTSPDERGPPGREGQTVEPWDADAIAAWAEIAAGFERALGRLPVNHPQRPDLLASYHDACAAAGRRAVRGLGPPSTPARADTALPGPRPLGDRPAWSTGPP